MNSGKMNSGKMSIVEFALSLFTEVKSGEGSRALLMTLNIFLILTAYLIAKVVREPLILAGGGAEIKSYASAIQVVLLLGAIRLYAWLVAKFARRQLINYVTLFFFACMMAFYLSLITVGAGVVTGVSYFLWVGIFSLVIIAQFWSFANDIYSTEQGNRLFVLLAFGASAGGVFGPKLADMMLDLVGVNNLLPISGGILLLSLVLTNFIESRYVDKPASPMTEAPTQPKPTEPEISKKGALKVVFRNRYLLLIALMILFTNWVNTTGEYVLGRGVVETAEQLVIDTPDAPDDFKSQYIGKFYADFYYIVGLVGMLMQLLVVSRIIKYLGVRFAILFLPIIAVLGYLSIFIWPVLATIRWAKTAENATDYSLNNTVRHILFLPTTKEEKYKAKVAIDSFFVRAGDVLSAGLVFVGTTWLSLNISGFAAVCLGLVVVWLFLAVAIGKKNRDLVKAQSTE